MSTLATRFPDDLAYTVFFDTTVFVTATIDEVIRTLVVAIVLVALVVFLFLGKLRTTLIPLVAVPVSIVGTFAVLLAIGYSANTVSLLALVLAIGIVVDDAIVVVENVERVIEEEPELSVPEACKKAMAEITGPIIAITLVLLSVFVPVAFIPGISGQLFRQFAVAVSVSMLISALNALTLSPALCAVLLKRGQTSRGPMRYVLGAIDSVRDGYVAVVRRLVRVAIVGVVVVVGVLAASAWLFSKTPQSFLPEEDQGAIFAALRLPEGASINRTAEVVKQVEDIVRPIPGVEGVLSVVGLNFIDYIASSNQAFFVIRLKPYEQRTDPAQSASAIITQLRPRLAAIQGAIVFPFNLPPILGLGNTGGFQYVLEALQGQPPTDLAATLRGLLVAANQQPELAGVFSTYAADTPQIYLDIDRDKAQVLGVKTHRHLQCAAIDDGQLLRQRLQRVRPHLAGQRPGRDAVSRTSRRHLSHLCAQQPRGDGADPRTGRGEDWCKGRRRWCATTDSAPRSSTARRSRATAPARRSLRWSASPPRRCRRATASNGPEPRSRKRRRAAARASSSGSPCSSPISFSSRSMRAGIFRFRCCCRSASACSARSSRSCWPD